MLYNLIFFLALFGVAWIIFSLINKRKIKSNKKYQMAEVKYLIGRFNVDKKLIDYKKLIRLINASNAFIISFVCTIISVLPLEFLWQMLIGFVLLFVLMFLCYELLGIYAVKKGWKKNGKKSQKNREKVAR